jgi:hypothetical protein
MIKRISCFRNRDDISIQAFGKYWDSTGAVPNLVF